MAAGILRRGSHPPPRAAAALLTVMGVLCFGSSTALATETVPANTVLPTISGTVQEGNKLKAAKGTWTGGSLVYTYQWQRCEAELPCANISTEATGQQYTMRYIDIGSQMRVVVTATNKMGATEAASEETVPVAAVAPKNTELPVITGAAEAGPEEGQVLSVSKGVWEGTPATKELFQWERCTPSKHCSAITGATETTYRVSAADIGETLRAKVTDENQAGSKTVTSLPTLAVVPGPPVAVGLPSIAGGLRVGGTLEAAPGAWDGLAPIEYTYAWESCPAEGSCLHASGPTYSLESGDVGNTVRLTVTAHNELGSATAVSVASPAVLGASDVFAVAWGEDLHGQLGTFYRTPWEETAVPVEAQSGIASLAAGGSFMLTLHSDGTVAASGAGIYGSIGDGARKATWEQGRSHVSVKGLSEVAAISADSEHALALLGNGNVEAWGNNSFGTLGNGKGGFETETGENQLEPKEVKALKGEGVVSIASGGGGNYAVLGNGKVMAWGHNSFGQLGVAWPTECLKKSTCEPSGKKPGEESPGTEIEHTEHKCFTETGWEICGKIPRPVVEGEPAVEAELPEGSRHNLEHVVAVRGGYQATYALLESGKVVSWGDDAKGELGQKLVPGVHTTFTKPGLVMLSESEPLEHVVAISAGLHHGLALREDGRVVGWGDNSTGALGELSGEHCLSGKKESPCDRYARPIAALSGVNVTAIGAGYGYSAVLGSEGKVYTVGKNNYGQLGAGPGCENEGGEMGVYASCYSRVWSAVPGVEHAQAIAAGDQSVVALLGAAAAPPFPPVGSEPQALSLKLEWGLPEAEASERLAYRVWEHPGENEVAEGEGTGGGGSGGGPVEEGTGEPPTNTTLPHIRVLEEIEEETRVVKGEIALGQILETTPGNWSGTEPINYEYQWLICAKGKCEPIPGATTYRYTLNELEDVGKTFEVKVTARNGVPPAGVATSEPTETVTEKGRFTKAESVNLTGQNGYLIDDLVGKPLEAQQYEAKLTSSNPTTGIVKIRTMVAQPLP